MSFAQRRIDGTSYEEAIDTFTNAWINCKKSLLDCPYQILIPIVKLGEGLTYPPWETALPCPGLAVCLRDILTSDGKRVRSNYSSIEKSGSIHQFLEWEGKVILSSIMSDRMVLGLTTELYVEIIEQLKPDYFMTPDGETYLGERYLSGYEINRVMKETKSMLTDVHNCAPIGLVKGSNVAQFCNHAKELVSVGVPLNVFHAGDFVNRESKNTIRVAIEIARAIRPLVPRLWIYGVGAERYFRLFQFADGFITQSHYINAFAGKDLGIGESSRLTSPSRELISRNLRVIQERLIRVHEGTKPQV